METINYDEQMQALDNFKYDIDLGCLKPLIKWIGEFNLFDILKITRTEIRHSNMLAWLLNPNENHGLDSSIIKGYIQQFEPSLMDYSDFLILREWNHIDILAVSSKDKFVLCIENKVDSYEHSDQLKRYQTSVERAYPDYTYLFVLLSPYGYEASESDWYSMAYQDVLKIIEDACKSKEDLLQPEAKLFIKNYVETIRRHIVGDKKLQETCLSIYKKHQKALDLIYENIPDSAYELAEIFKKWAIKKTDNGEIEVVIEQCKKYHTRFKTSYMSLLLPDAKEAKSGWGTKNHYFYEIYYDRYKNDFRIQLAFSGKDIPTELRGMCERINNKRLKVNFQWRTTYRTKSSKVKDEIIEEEIFKQLDKKLEEINAYERELENRLINN